MINTWNRKRRRHRLRQHLPLRQVEHKKTPVITLPLSEHKMPATDSMKLLLIALSLSLIHGKNFEFRLIQSNNIQRQELLQQKCDKYDLDNNELYQNNSIHTMSDADLEHLLIDRKHKLLYCYVPKVSCFIYLPRTWCG